VERSGVVVAVVVGLDVVGLVVVVVVVVVVVRGEPVPALPPRVISPALQSEVKHGHTVAFTVTVNRSDAT